MRIQRPQFDDISGRQPQTIRPAGERSSPATSNSRSDAPPVSLSRLLASGGMPQSPSLIRSLEAALANAGIDPTALDRTSALRALLLHRHNLPLTEAAVTGDLGRLPAITEAVASLVDDARALLATGKLSAPDHRLVAAFVGDIASLFDHPVLPPTLSDALAAAVDRWAFDTESLLITLVSGDSDAAAMFTGPSSEAADRMLAYLLSPQPLDSLPASTREVIEVFRNSVFNFMDVVSATDMSRPDTGAALREALAQLESRVPDIVSMLTSSAVSSEAQAPLMDALRELFGRQLASLQAILEPFIADAFNGPAAGDARDLAGLVHRSGIMFEWHLLAWYRAGKDPARLRTLYRRDLKGILLAFTRSRSDTTGSGHDPSPLGRLRTQAADVLERIGTIQQTNLLDRHLHPQSAVLEFPLGGKPGNGRALVRVAGEGDEQSQQNRSPRQFTLSFAVDTTALGTVTAYLTVTGKAISVAVELDDERWLETGGGMVEEVRSALNSHGFAVGEVTVVRTGTRRAAQPRRRPGEDIVA